MGNGIEISGRTAVTLLSVLANFNPALYDAPPFDDYNGTFRLVSSPQPEPWRVALQPLASKVSYTYALASAHIQEIIALDKIGALFGGEVAERVQNQATRLLDEFEELCPRPPLPPPHWPPGPRLPLGREQMAEDELLVFGLSFLAASEFVGQGRVQDGLVRLGQKALDLSTKA